MLFSHVFSDKIHSFKAQPEGNQSWSSILMAKYYKCTLCVFLVYCYLWRAYMETNNEIVQIVFHLKNESWVKTQSHNIFDSYSNIK